jgi:hypothetical protein
MSTSPWDDVRRLADEIEVKVHLAGMDARDRWNELKPRLAKLDRQFNEVGKRANDAIEKEARTIGVELKRLRDQIFGPPH